MLLQWGEGRQRAWVDDSAQAGGVWAVIIHGGAWQSAETTYDSGFELAAQLKPHFAGVASLDYRLSPQVHHPGHINDCLVGFDRIVAQFHPVSIVLVGHSCGAFLSGQLSLERPDLVQHVVCVEGIYDLHVLVEEYPAYSSFVVNAFGLDHTQWPVFDWRHAKVGAIIHSKQDELLTLKQPKWLAQLINVDPIWLERGKHDEVYEQLPKDWASVVIDLASTK